MPLPKPEGPYASLKIGRRDGARLMIAKYDLADAALVERYSWHLNIQPHTAYAYARIPVGDHTIVTGMHQLILGGPGRTTHLNGNGLDNRRANLAFADQSVILAKRRPVGGKSRFKGVSYDDNVHRWVARFRGKNLGRFDIEEDAARAFDDAAFEQWGHQAYFNFPEEVADWTWPLTPVRARKR